MGRDPLHPAPRAHRSSALFIPSRHLGARHPRSLPAHRIPPFPRRQQPPPPHEDQERRVHYRPRSPRPTLSSLCRIRQVLAAPRPLFPSFHRPGPRPSLAGPRLFSLGIFCPSPLLCQGKPRPVHLELKLSTKKRGVSVDWDLMCKSPLRRRPKQPEQARGGGGRDLLGRYNKVINDEGKNESSQPNGDPASGLTRGCGSDWWRGAALSFLCFSFSLCSQLGLSCLGFSASSSFGSRSLSRFRLRASEGFCLSLGLSCCLRLGPE